MEFSSKLTTATHLSSRYVNFADLIFPLVSVGVVVVVVAVVVLSSLVLYDYQN